VPTEADIRSAISRSYYAVFHHTLVWWKSNSHFPAYKDQAHAKLQMGLFNAGIPDARVFSKTLRKLSKDRQEADYDLAGSFDLKQGQSILNLARLAIATFDALDKTSLADGVEDYLRKTNQL
jgi:hypothetical protein